MRSPLTLLLYTLLFINLPAWAEFPSSNQLPMYGNQGKPKHLNEADDAFVQKVIDKGYTREQGSVKIVQLGWRYWGKQDYSSAMPRFNQAWLLDPENSSTYHGFALVQSIRGAAPKEIEALFKMAISKPNAAAEVFVDYGRFLWRQERFDESIVELQKALAISPMAENAASNLSFVYYQKEDPVNACFWAKKVRDNQDELAEGYLEDMCLRAGGGL